MLRFSSLSLRKAWMSDYPSLMIARAKASASYSNRRDQMCVKGEIQKVIVPASNAKSRSAGAMLAAASPGPYAKPKAR